jgi:hypothetical protein
VLGRVRGRAALTGLTRATVAGLIAGAAGGLAGYGCARGLGTGGPLLSLGVAALAAVVAALVFVVVAYVIDGRDLRAALTRKVNGNEQ